MSDGRVRIDVLGPLRVAGPSEQDLTPDGALQRRLLALLVLRRGRVVSTDSAIDALWPDRPPRDPSAALHNHVFRLKRAIGPDVINSNGWGYSLDPSRVDLDIDRVLAALESRDRDALGLLLHRWHGPAYADLDEHDDARVEALRLEELRLRAIETHVELRLAAGDTVGIVAELTALADEHPLRERPQQLLMSALAHEGRTAEALRVFDHFRRRLADELGIEPSPLISAQQAELLAGGSVGEWKPANRVPIPATSLVGRDDALRDVMTAWTTRRIVTVVGPGGVGKTRLLVELGRQLVELNPSPAVVLCELAPAVETSAIDAVAAALGVDGRSGIPLVDRLADVVGDNALTLLLDNCEHVVQAIAFLVERLTASCPEVRVVATSRERLRVAGEQLVSLSPLPFGSADSPAVELFVERGRAVAPSFTPDADEVELVEEIVRRLDGLPLAIELAAARLHTHDLTEIVAALDDRFALLSAGTRTSSRHGSLATAITWSFGLLEPHLQRVFLDVSMFAGAFTAEDAARVCALTPAAASDALHQLGERSLAMRAPDHRHVLLDTLRAFGSDELAASGRGDVVAERHARHFVEWLLAAPDLVDIDAALPELRKALEWLVSHDQIDSAGQLVGGLVDYGFFRLRPDILGWATTVTNADPADASVYAPLVWTVAAYAAWLEGDLATCTARTQRALEVARRQGGDIDPRVPTMCGNDALFQGRLDEAATWYLEAIELSTDDRVNNLLARGTHLLALGYAGDPSTEDKATQLLAVLGDADDATAAYVWYCAGEAVLDRDTHVARERLTRAIELAEQTQAIGVSGLAGASRASIDARSGDPYGAAEEFRRLIVRWRRAGVWSTQWTMLRSIAGLLARLGRFRDAAVLEGAIRTTQAGHRIFGADEVALAELGARLRAELGGEEYAQAVEAGGLLDGDAAVEHALRALDVTSVAAP